MTDSYSSTFGKRSIARIPAALLLLVALLFAAPASGQTTIVYQFTGLADGQINNGPFTNKLVRIEFRGVSTNRFTGAIQGDLTEEAWIVPDSDGITIIVDGVHYLIDETNITLRRPDSNPVGDESSFELADGIVAGGSDLDYPGLAFHWENSGPPNSDSEFFHYFKGHPGTLTTVQTDLLTSQSNVALTAEEQNRGGTASDIGYPIDGGGKIEIDFNTVGGDVLYSTFSGGGIDYGDAPDTGAGTGAGNYNTLATDGGPSHFTGGPVLGALVDDETGLLQDATATADDLDTGDDEDGVTFPISIVASAGTANTSSVAVNVTGSGGNLDAWFDFNQNGAFEVSEKVIDGVAVLVKYQLIPFTIPAGATPGTTFARFRISTAGVSLPIGAAADGEVEDHQVTLLDGATVPDIGLNLGAGTLIQPITIRATPGPGGDTEIFDGTNTTLFSAPQSAVDELDVTGTSAADKFIVDYVNGKVANGTITIDGGLPAISPGDEITLNNGMQDTIEHEYTNASDGFIRYLDNPGPPFETIAYLNLEPITDNLDAVNRIFTFNAAANDIDYDFVSGGPSVIRTSTSTSETTTFNGPSLSGANVVINGNGGADTFTVEPSDAYPITVNGGAPTTAPGDVFELNTASLGGGKTISLVENSNVDGVYSVTGGFLDVTYTSMEQVNLRFSDPNAFSGDTYPGDYFYPINSETGISVEPYFNWDHDNWPTAGALALSTLTLLVSENSDLSSPLFSTTTWEDNVTFLISRVDVVDKDDDHYVTDIDRAWNSAFPLKNDSRYYWGLVALMAGGDTFQQSARFDTVQELEPVLDFPDDGLTLFSQSILFNWNVASPAQPAVYWRMDLDAAAKAGFDGATPSAMGGDAFNDDDSDPADGFAAETEFDAADLPSPLVWGTTYSWRVATMWPVPPTGWVPQEVHDRNETDRAVTFSSISEFSMVSKAVVPTPSYPIGGLTVPTNTPELNWWVGGPFENLTFDLEIRIKGGAAVCSIPTWPTGITGIQFDTDGCNPALLPGTEYEWRVRSDDGTSTSAWSAWENFITSGQGLAGPVFPSYPVGGLEIYTINPQFHWFTEQDNTGISFVAHYLERTGTVAPANCAAIKGTGGVVSLASSVGVTHVDVTNLEPGATYDWCVTSTGLNGSFDSDVATFEVAGGMDKNFPAASWPIGNPTVFERDQILHWFLEGSRFDWVSFDVEYCVSPDVFGDPGCTTVTGITEQQYEVTGLDYGDVVTWRVRAHYTSGPVSDWNNPASQGSFTVVGLLSTVTAVPTHPVGDLVIFNTTATFSWYVAGATNVADFFKIQYSYAESFPFIGNITIETTTSNEFLTVEDLIPGHTYWWRIAVSNDGGATFGAWSTVASFSIDPGASAPTPRIGGPTNLVGVATASPTLSWLIPMRSTSDVVYDIRYSNVSDQFSEGEFVEVTDLPTPFVRLGGLEAGDYYWQVRSRTVDGSSISPYSETGSFTTSSVLSVDTEEAPDAQLPTSFSLKQNYPNPFSPSTTIAYGVAETSGVTLRIFDVLGREVRTLVDQTVAPGQHTVRWDGTDVNGRRLPSGLYLYRMDAGSFTYTRSLVLMQ